MVSFILCLFLPLHISLVRIQFAVIHESPHRTAQDGGRTVVERGHRCCSTENRMSPGKGTEWFSQESAVALFIIERRGATAEAVAA